MVGINPPGKNQVLLALFITFIAVVGLLMFAAAAYHSSNDPSASMNVSEYATYCLATTPVTDMAGHPVNLAGITCQGVVNVLPVGEADGGEYFYAIGFTANDTGGNPHTAVVGVDSVGVNMPKYLKLVQFDGHIAYIS